MKEWEREQEEHEDELRKLRQRDDKETSDDATKDVDKEHSS